jgi:hypothetical protein
LADLPLKIGVSPSMMHAYRSGKYPISPKAWRKLEAAERAAGIGGSRLPEAIAFAERSGHPDNPPPFSGTEAEIRALVREELAASTRPAFTLAQLEERMRAAGAWPATGPDRDLPLADLWQKYAP